MPEPDKYDEEFFVMIPQSILCRGDLPASAKLLFGVIRGFVRQFGSCRGSNAFLAEELGMGLTSIRDMIRLLEKQGLVRRSVNENGRYLYTCDPVGRPTGCRSTDTLGYPIDTLSPVGVPTGGCRPTDIVVPVEQQGGVGTPTGEVPVDRHQLYKTNSLDKFLNRFGDTLVPARAQAHPVLKPTDEETEQTEQTEQCEQPDDDITTFYLTCPPSDGAKDWDMSSTERTRWLIDIHGKDKVLAEMSRRCAEAGVTDTRRKAYDFVRSL